MGCDLSLHTCQKQQQRWGTEPGAHQAFLTGTNPAWAIAATLANAFICRQPTSCCQGHIPCLESLQSTWHHKASAQPSRSQGRQKSSLAFPKGNGPQQTARAGENRIVLGGHAAALPGVLWVAQLSIPPHKCILLAGTAPQSCPAQLHWGPCVPQNALGGFSNVCHPSLGASNV